MKLSIYLRELVSGIMLCLLVLPVEQGYASDDAGYARKMNQEALRSADKTQQYSSIADALTKRAFDANQFDVVNGTLPADLSYSEFEGLLRENFMGSYIFFKRLRKDAREEVYQHYKKDPSMSAMRQRVIHLSRSEARGLTAAN